ncbi:hypothetical protein B0H10DRAFT_1815141, partial [Mycena sp. CBHHK59/15]
DYSYEGLKTNMPAALASVQLSVIRKWEHHMIRWMEAYRNNLGPKQAQRVCQKSGKLRRENGTTYPSMSSHPPSLLAMLVIIYTRLLSCPMEDGSFLPSGSFPKVKPKLNAES